MVIGKAELGRTCCRRSSMRLLVKLRSFGLLQRRTGVASVVVVAALHG
jgi:hypothetical protein